MIQQCICRGVYLPSNVPIHIWTCGVSSQIYRGGSVGTLPSMVHHTERGIAELQFYLLESTVHQMPSCATCTSLGHYAPSSIYTKTRPSVQRAYRQSLEATKYSTQASAVSHPSPRFPTTMSSLDISKVFSVQGLVAVVTGGGTGIGLMIARALEHNGAKVYILGRREEVLKNSATKNAVGQWKYLLRRAGFRVLTCLDTWQPNTHRGRRDRQGILGGCGL